MILFGYWFKRFFRLAALFMASFLVLFLMLTMTKYIDDWLLASGKLSHFLLIVLCFIPTAIKIILPLATAIALVFTQRDFLDAHEWQAMLVQGLSLRRYVGWVLSTAVLWVVFLNGAIKISHSTMLTQRLVTMATQSLGAEGLKNIAPGTYKFLPKQHLLFYRDPVYPDRFIIASSSGKKSEESLMVGHSTKHAIHLPHQLLDGKIYFLNPKHQGFSVAMFDQMAGFVPKHFDVLPYGMLHKLFGRVFSTDYWSYSLFLVWMMLWSACCPWVATSFGRIKSCLAIVGLYAIYLHLLKMATTPLWQHYGPPAMMMSMVHLAFLLLWLVRLYWYHHPMEK